MRDVCQICARASPRQITLTHNTLLLPTGITNIYIDVIEFNFFIGNSTARMT